MRDKFLHKFKVKLKLRMKIVVIFQLFQTDKIRESEMALTSTGPSRKYCG